MNKPCRKLLAFLLTLAILSSGLPSVTAVAEGENCAHIHDDTCGYVEGAPCAHVHDEACGGLPLGDSGNTATPTNTATAGVTIDVPQNEYGEASFFLPENEPITDADLLDGVTATDENGDPVPVTVQDADGLDYANPQMRGAYPNPPYIITYSAKHPVSGAVFTATRELYVTLGQGAIMPLASAGDYPTLQTECSNSGVDTVVTLTANIIGGNSTLTIERDLTLDLNGKNLTIDCSGSSGSDGVKIENGVKLTIKDSNPGSNKLTVKGGTDGAGINVTVGTLIIESGTIEATGGNSGAGIGGGNSGGGGDITIRGGNVTANGGNSGAGIGGGNSGDGGDITISGGNVTANGGDGGVGIGGGGAGIGGGDGGNGGNTTISGGNVTANGGTGIGGGNSYGGGAGIGGGGGPYLTGGYITIRGGNIKATGIGGGAGIGGCGGAGIGGIINITDGNIEATGIGGGAGIGGGGNAGDITIRGGTVTATAISGAGSGGAGIGGGDGGTIKIGGNAQVTAIGADGHISVHSTYGFEAFGGGAGIGGGGGSGPITSNSGDITIDGSANVTARGGAGAGNNTHKGHAGAGIGSGGAGQAKGMIGNVGSVGTVSITTTGTVIAVNGAANGTNAAACVGEGGGHNGPGSRVPGYWIITATASVGGTITPAGNIVCVTGSGKTFAIAHGGDCVIHKVRVDGIPDAAAKTNKSYTFSNIIGDHTIEVTFDYAVNAVPMTRSNSRSSYTPSISAPTETWLDETQAAVLASGAKKRGENYVRTRSAISYGVRAAAWAKLAGLQYEHDTVADGAVQVRLCINDPAKLAKDMMVSGYAKGADVDWVKSHFEKWFKNNLRAIHFDQQGVWGQPVQIAARVDLAGMDTDNLYFYRYDKATNTYRRIEKPAYWIDNNGYLHFTTEYAGDIIISDGPLERK